MTAASTVVNGALLPDCTEVIEGVSLETTGCAEYPFALQFVGTLVEVDDADYCPGDLVNATVTRAFSADELRTLGQALLTAAERLAPAPARTAAAQAEGLIRGGGQA